MEKLKANVGDKDKLDNILSKEDPDEIQSKEFEQEVLRILKETEQPIPENVFKRIQFGVMLPPREIKEVVGCMNLVKQRVSDQAKENETLSERVDHLKKSLQQELEKEVPNIDEITEQIASQRVEEVRRQFLIEKEQQTRDLQDRVEKVIGLELELDELRDAYRQLEGSMSKEDQ